jgi:hypothetical protein
MTRKEAIPGLLYLRSNRFSSMETLSRQGFDFDEPEGPIESNLTWFQKLFGPNSSTETPRRVDLLLEQTGLTGSNPMKSPKILPGLIPLLEPS